MAVTIRRRRSSPERGCDGDDDDDDSGITKIPLIPPSKSSDENVVTSDHACTPDSSKDELPLSRVLISSIPLVILATATATLGLETLAEDMLTASIRTFVQLSCLGAILSPLFKTDHSCMSIAYVFCFMLPLASYEATARSPLTYPGAYLTALAGLGTAVASMLSVAIFAVVRPTPRYSPRHVIPLGGMLISNALSGTALAMGDLLDELHHRSARVEVMLAMGATAWEAVFPTVSAAIRKALVPQISGMNVIGLVAIPGMMTGQVLAGASPVRAARYQIMIMYLIAAGTGLSAGLTTAMTVRNLFNGRGVYLGELIVVNSSPRVSQLLGQWKASNSLLRNNAVSQQADVLLKAAGASNSLVELRAEHNQPPTPTFDALLELDLNGTVALKRPLRAHMSLYHGNTHCLVGPSGIGKSTILRSIAELANGGTIDATSSIIRLAGRERDSYTPSEWRRRVVYVPQAIASSLPGTPLDLIDGVRALKGRQLHRNGSLNRDTVIRYLLAWGLSDAESAVERPWSDLSGGEAQRALLAIAFASEPDVLLLDEPTSALDEKTKGLVEDSLGRLGSAVLVVTHDEEQAVRIGRYRWRLVEVEGGKPTNRV